MNYLKERNVNWREIELTESHVRISATLKQKSGIVPLYPNNLINLEISSSDLLRFCHHFFHLRYHSLHHSFYTCFQRDHG